MKTTKEELPAILFFGVAVVGTVLSIVAAVVWQHIIIHG